MPIGISTLGKFGGVSTKEAASAFGGGDIGPPTPPQQKQHKFPKLKVKPVDRNGDGVEVKVNFIEDEDYNKV